MFDYNMKLVNYDHDYLTFSDYCLN